MKVLLLITITIFLHGQSDSLVIDFLYKLQDSINENNPSFYNKSFDKNALLKTALKNFPVPVKQYNEILNGFSKGFNLHNQLAEGVKRSDDGHFVVRTYDNTADTITATFRLVVDGKANFHRYYIVYKMNRFKIIDTYVYTSGELLSKTMETNFASVFLKEQSFIDKLSSKLFGKADDYDSLRKMSSFLRNKNYKEVHNVYNSLSDNVKNLKTAQILNIQATGQLSDSLLFQSMEYFEKLYPKDESLNLLMIDSYVLKEKYKDAIQLISNLQETIENDGYLHFLKSNLYLMNKETEKFEIEALAAINTESWLSGPYFTLLELYITQKRYKDAVALMKQAYVNAEIVFDKKLMEEQELFIPFIASKEFK